MNNTFTRTVTRGLVALGLAAAAVLGLAGTASAAEGDLTSHQIGTICIHHVKYELWVDTAPHLVPLHQSC